MDRLPANYLRLTAALDSHLAEDTGAMSHAQLYRWTLQLGILLGRHRHWLRAFTAWDREVRAELERRGLAA